MSTIIGIDLGTTNSVAAYMSRRRPKVIRDPRTGVYWTPSVVLAEMGQRWVGQEARDRSPGSRNRIYSIKRLMGVDYASQAVDETLKRASYAIRPAQNGEAEVLFDNEYYSPQQISAMILEQIKRNAESALGEPISDAVITVPAYFSQRQKEATRQAGRLAGLNVVRILNEPTAAALAFGAELDEGELRQVLVYDLGGGTFDVSIMLVSSDVFDVLNYDGSNFLGGDDFDTRIVERLYEYLDRQYSVDFRDNPPLRDKLKQLAEKAKIELSMQSQTRIVAEQIYSMNGMPVNLDYTLTLVEFESLIAPLVEKTLEIVERSIRGAHKELEDIDSVLMVGGSTLVPLVRRRLRDVFGNRVEFDIDPMQCVAIGAALMANMVAESEGRRENLQENIRQGAVHYETLVYDSVASPSMEMIDILSKHLGIEVKAGPSTTDSNLNIVIEKQTPFPTQDPYRTELYTQEPNQAVYILPIYEIEGVDATKAESTPRQQWEQVGIVTNEKLPAGLPKGTPVMVEMMIDKDGILTVSSYLKEYRDATYVKESFHFVSAKAASSTDKANQRDKDADQETRNKLDFYQNFFDIIASEPAFNRFLFPGQADELKVLSQEIERILSNGSGEDRARLLVRAETTRANIPAPTETVFWVQVFRGDGTFAQQRQMDQSQHAMEQAIAQNQFERANQHLAQLRQTLDEVATAKPESSRLLSALRKPA